VTPPAGNADRLPSAEGTPIIELTGISKAYPGVQANDDVSLSLRAGEVHCLLGENGAGKSTLIGLLAGLVRPDRGRIMVDGVEVSIDSPRTALELGIGTVYQHSTLIPAMTVLENLMLGDSRQLRLDAVGAQRRLQEFATRLGVEVDPEARAADLALGAQQQVEIIKALWRGSRVLILDEPTSMLTPQAFADLEQVLGKLKEEGQAIVFITHKLHEALSLGDRISVLRHGKLVGSIDERELASTPHDELRELLLRTMFGEETGSLGNVAELHEELPERERTTYVENESMLELRSVSATGVGAEMGIEDVSFMVALGEILGVAGIDGNGQRALAEVIAGQRPASAGQILLYDVRITGLTVAARQKLGLRYVTDDRLGEGIVSPLPVSLNLFLKRIGQQPFWRRGRIQRSVIDRRAEELVSEFDVRTPSVSTRAGTLSGGNIQKVILARELSFDPKVVVFHKPTYGLDVRTTSVVRTMISQLARDGGAALVISTDLDELLEICDRIAVLSRGRLVGVLDNGPGAAQRIGELMVGSAEPAAAA
jgi:simple sugar transport system ATP-binding protein